MKISIWIFSVKTTINPLPQANDNVRQVEVLRHLLDLTENDDVLPQDAFENYPPSLKDKIRDLYYDHDFVETLNPYIRNIVRRTRDYLEKTINPQTGDPYLKKINVQLLGEGEDGALKLQGYMKQAYETAQEFSTMLSRRVKGGGFMSTLVLKRIGSTMIAGERTAEKLMSWTYTSDDTEEDTTYFDADEDMDESGSMNDQDTKRIQSEMKQLTAEEKACLEKLIAVLHSNRDTDPKYLRVRDVLKDGVEDDGGWLEKGCIIFSQYFDSAQYVAELLSKDFRDEPIGLYAGGDRSGIYKDGLYTKRDKDTLKKMVRNHELRVLVGTDAASEGLNLQSLSTLINLDLPWNPTRLEQRKGRIQRIGQLAETIKIYNMRYKDSVEDRVHEKLSDRLQAVFNLFGQIPEVLEDVWVAVAQNDEQKALEAINKVPKKNPFIMKYETGIPNNDKWEICANVLDKHEKYRILMSAWK